MAYIFFAIATMLYPVTQILQKRGMTDIGSITSFGAIFNLEFALKVLRNPFIISGVGLSLVALVFWLSSMSSLKISYLYPLGAGIQNIILFVLAITVLGETATTLNWLGIGVITTGIILLHL